MSAARRRGTACRPSSRARSRCSRRSCAPSLERPPGSAVRCRSPASRRSRSSVWTCMLAIATRSIAPMTTATEIAAPGSSVWTCTFTSGASPTTRRQSPISSSACSSASRSIVLALDEERRAVAVPRLLEVHRLEPDRPARWPRSAPRPPRRAAPRTRRGRTPAARLRRHRRRRRRAARRASPGCGRPTPRPRRGSPSTASSSGRSATRSAASAISRMTVSIVPSIGCCTGL